MDILLKKAFEYGLKFKDQGQGVDYIPALKDQDLEKRALSLVNEKGKVYSLGDSECRFTMQSISKVLTFLLLLEIKPIEEIQKTIDIKPTALPFNSVLDLELGKGKPRNPMVSIGAIATVALLYQEYGDKTFDYILNNLKKIVGNENLNYSEKIYKSEIETGYKNVAGTLLMVQAGILPKDSNIEKIIEIYYKCCTLMVNTLELSKFSHLISNDGYSVYLQEQIYSSNCMRILRAIMAHSGMYDMSGEFSVSVGLPAKSGVGGGIIACTRTKLGLASFSPRLDQAGNSIFGIKTLEYISKKLNLSIY